MFARWARYQRDMYEQVIWPRGHLHDWGTSVRHAQTIEKKEFELAAFYPDKRRIEMGNSSQFGDS